MWPRASHNASKVRAAALRKCALSFEYFGGLGAFVDREVVEDHDVSGLKGGGQLGFDPEVERDAVHGAMDDPRRCEPVAAQPGDEGLRVPTPEGSVSWQAVPTEASPA